MISVALIFGAQILLIFVLSARPRVVTTPPASRVASLKISNVPMTEAEFSKNFLASDPMLFATARSDGFSPWLKVPARDYEAEISTTRADRPFWLALEPGRLGSNLTQGAHFTAAPIKLAQDVAPKIQLPAIDPLENAKTNSRFRVEGDLIARALREVPVLTNWAHAEILSNTVAEVAVDQRGLVVSARLLGKSGLAEADRWAMNQARHAQFAPAPVGMTWGKLVFDWMTLPVATTNAATGLSP